MGTTIALLVLGFTLHRLISGARNAFLYSNKEDGMVYAAFCVVGISGLALSLSDIAVQLPTWGFEWIPTNAIPVLAALSGISSTLALGYRLFPRSGILRDIHLHTLAEQTLLAAAIALSGPYGLVAMVLAVYPAVFAQKAVLNIMIEKDWDYNGTDDPSGDTYGIPSIGIKVPRTTQKTRLLLALASIAVLIALTLIY